eukprot:UN27284
MIRGVLLNFGKNHKIIIVPQMIMDIMKNDVTM